MTGAFSYTCAVIARRLLDEGYRVATLSRRPPPAGHPLAGRVPWQPLQFADGEALARAMAHTDVLVNTHWIRFARAGMTFGHAVDNSRRLFAAAGRAGVRRIVHISVTNASPGSPFAYFRGKAAVEAALTACPGAHAVIRPSLVFGGREEVLINNIAWLLRRLPLYAVPGDGRYRVQPVCVEDVADAALAAAGREASSIEDAVGPETYTFDELLLSLRDALGLRTRLVHLPPAVVAALGAGLGRPLRDVLITREELGALMAEQLVSHRPATGHRSFAAWLPGQSSWLGRRYANELRRNWHVH